MVDWLFDKLGLKKKATEWGAATDKPETPALPPANALERTVQDAPPVAARLKRTEEQLRREALQTMAIMEAAREDKGIFCLTLGEGESRGVLLVAPIEGVHGTSVSLATAYRSETTYTATRNDYYLLTAKGPRRVSFHTQYGWGGDSEEQKKERLEYDKKEQKEEERLRAIIDDAIKGNNPNLKDSSFSEWRDSRGRIEFTLDLNSTRSMEDSRRLRRHTEFAPGYHDQFKDTAKAAIVTDDNAVKQALQNSLEKVQAPLQARLDSARAQIKSTTTIRDGLK